MSVCAICGEPTNEQTAVYLNGAVMVNTPLCPNCRGQTSGAAVEDFVKKCNSDKSLPRHYCERCGAEKSSLVIAKGRDDRNELIYLCNRCSDDIKI